MGKLKIWGAASMASLAATCLPALFRVVLSPPLVDKAEIVFSNGGRILDAGRRLGPDGPHPSRSW